MKSQDLRTIKSAHRVLEILEYFDRDHHTATVMDLARSLGYPQSSTSELLRCLTRLGYLHYNRYDRTYMPTARVALLGSWVAPALFRGGAVISALDRISQTIGETVVLSTAINYVVQHMHVVKGTSPDAIDVHAGEIESLTHSPQGKLLLSSYQDAHIRSALHRLNAEEDDPERRVRIADYMKELGALRPHGWVFDGEYRAGDGSGIVTALLPQRCGAERLVLSVVAKKEVFDERKAEIVDYLLAERSSIVPAKEISGERMREDLSGIGRDAPPRPSDYDSGRAHLH